MDSGTVPRRVEIERKRRQFTSVDTADQFAMRGIELLDLLPGGAYRREQIPDIPDRLNPAAYLPIEVVDLSLSVSCMTPCRLPGLP